MAQAHDCIKSVVLSFYYAGRNLREDDAPETRVVASRSSSNRVGLVILRENARGISSAHGTGFQRRASRRGHPFGPQDSMTCRETKSKTGNLSPTNQTWYPRKDS
jgi:hypothetical protein